MSKRAPQRQSGDNSRTTSITVSKTVSQRYLGKGRYTLECKSTQSYVSCQSGTQQTTKVDTSEKLKVGWTPSTELSDKKKTGTTNKLLEGKRGRPGDKPGESSKLAALYRKAKLGKGRRSVSPSSSLDSDSDDSD